MKKTISSILIIVMLVSCMFSFVSVGAVQTSDLTVEIKGAIMRDWITQLSNSMPEDKLERSRLYGIFKSYMYDDKYIENVIKVLTGETQISTVPGLEDLFNALDLQESQRKNQMIFVLSFFKSIEKDRRIEYIQKFDQRTSVTFNDDDNYDALLAIYNSMVPAEGRTKLAEHKRDDKGIDEKVIFNLFKSLNGYFVLTDDAVGGSGFQLKADYISADFTNFVSRFMNNISRFSTINGKSYTNSTKGFKDLINDILTGINNDDTNYPNSLNANIKAVLGEIGLYEKLEAVPATPSPDPTRRPGSGGNRGGTVVVETSQPTSEPTPAVTILPKPEPATAEDEVYEDLQSHWSKDYVAALTRRNVFKGYDNGSFEPDWGITRQEMAVVMIRALGLEGKLGTAAGQAFADNDSIAEWARDSVQLCIDLGIYTGYDDNEFKPSKTISREELIAIIIRSIENGAKRDKLYFADSEEVGSWAKDFVNQATTMGIVGGYEDGTFKPKNSVTRAEAAKIIYNFMYVKGLF